MRHDCTLVSTSSASIKREEKTCPPPKIHQASFDISPSQQTVVTLTLRAARGRCPYCSGYLLYRIRGDGLEDLALHGAQGGEGVDVERVLGGPPLVGVLGDPQHVVTGVVHEPEDPSRPPVEVSHSLSSAHRF
jgi:hypothetical protein